MSGVLADDKIPRMSSLESKKSIHVDSSLIKRKLPVIDIDSLLSQQNELLTQLEAHIGVMKQLKNQSEIIICQKTIEKNKKILWKLNELKRNISTLRDKQTLYESTKSYKKNVCFHEYLKTLRVNNTLINELNYFFKEKGIEFDTYLIEPHHNSSHKFRAQELKRKPNLIFDDNSESDEKYIVFCKTRRHIHGIFISEIEQFFDMLFAKDSFEIDMKIQEVHSENKHQIKSQSVTTQRRKKDVLNKNTSLPHQRSFDDYTLKFKCPQCFEKNPQCVSRIDFFNCKLMSELKTLSKESYDMYTNIAKQRVVSEYIKLHGANSIAYCIKPQCRGAQDGFIVSEKIDEDSGPLHTNDLNGLNTSNTDHTKRRKCIYCQTEFCFRCKDMYHYGKPCAGPILTQYADLEIRNLIRDSMVACPECQYPYEKLQGCNHAICPMCMTHFCFRCGVKRNEKDPYYHSCPPGFIGEIDPAEHPDLFFPTGYTQTKESVEEKINLRNHLKGEFLENF